MERSLQPALDVIATDEADLWHRQRPVPQATLDALGGTWLGYSDDTPSPVGHHPARRRRRPPPPPSPYLSRRLPRAAPPAPRRPGDTENGVKPATRYLTPVGPSGLEVFPRRGSIPTTNAWLSRSKVSRFTGSLAFSGENK